MARGAAYRPVAIRNPLARAGRQAGPAAKVFDRAQIPVRQGAATVRVLVGDRAAIELGTPAGILDVEVAAGGRVTTPVPAQFQGGAYLLGGEAAFGGLQRRATPAQLVVLAQATSSP